MDVGLVKSGVTRNRGAFADVDPDTPGNLEGFLDVDDIYSYPRP